MSWRAPAMVTPADVAAALEEARARTLAILDPVPDADQRRQVSELMSPMCWDLAHIGHYEELWLLRTLGGAPATDELYDDVYDAFRHPRRERPSLPILGPAEARAFDANVRRRVLDALATTTFDPADPLRRDGFVHGMVVQHEHQHDETLLATIQLLDGFAHPDADGEPQVASPSRRESDPATQPGEDLPADVLVPGGIVTLGTDDHPWAYDNERPAHQVETAPFRIDTVPVTNAAFAEFVADGGYDEPAHWTSAGWAWRSEAGLVAPQFWARDGGGGWVRRRYGRLEPLPAAEPVQHVCWYEADAYARWAGARLPTEAEWERAAQGSDPDAANLWHAGTHRWGPSIAGSRPGGASAAGAHQMLGDVWEWTASDFSGYPGFAAFPYREYSEVFFGTGYKVLRGGSWATHPTAMRTTFRNWDFPIRRQIFAGFRCARDA